MPNEAVPQTQPPIPPQIQLTAGWACLVEWLALGSTVALLAVQDRAGTLHPVCIPMLLLLGLAVGAAAWQLWRTRGGWKKLVLSILGIALPLVLLAIPIVRVRGQWAERQVPHDVFGRLVMVLAAGLMEGQATHFYPQRVETDRLVMFYSELDHPRLDAETMERHVAQLEAKIGAPLRSPIHWVRGSLLGQGNCSFLGVALGSVASPADWSGSEGNLDRHELAHAVIVQQRPVSADPPMVLHEGWAESQSGISSQELAARALQHRQSHPDTQLADLFAADTYHLDSGAAYTVGGAFVDFLVRRFGAGKFVELYNRCQRDTYEADFQAVYGQTLGDLEASFWEDARAVGG